MGLILNDSALRSCLGSTIFTKTSPNIKKFLQGLDDGSSGVDVSKLRKYADGSVFRVTEGLRTMKRQLELYLAGRNVVYRNLGLGVKSSFESKPQYMKKSSVITDKSKVVTNAFAGQSAHNYGLAVDMCIRSIGIPKSNLTMYDGEALTLKQLYTKIGLLAWAKRCGLEWGGDWTEFPDYAHFEDQAYSYPIKSDYETQDGFSGNTFWKDTNANFASIERWNENFKNVAQGKKANLKPQAFLIGLGVFSILVKPWRWFKK